MKPREFHIWQFPEDKIRVLFRNNKEFVDNAIKSFGTIKSLGDFLEIHPNIISSWKKYPLYIPLLYVKKIVDKLNLNWAEIEKDIVSYKGINTSAPIFNPKLPIKETPKIFSLITHIICDGSVNKNGIPSYINSNKSLIDNIDQTLKKSFGNINNKLYFGKGDNKNCYEYRFSKIVIDLLEHFYKIRLYKANRLPKEIFDLPKEFSIAVIKAFADDEGNVDLNRRIGIYSTNKKILETLIKLLREKLGFTNISDTKEKGENYYYFYIKSNDILKYERKIGFIHQSKKEKLRYIIESRKGKGMHGKVGETKEKLLNLLKDNVLSTYDIMKQININKSNINMQIKRLEDEGLIVQNNKIGQTVFWTRRK